MNRHHAVPSHKPPPSVARARTHARRRCSARREYWARPHAGHRVDSSAGLRPRRPPRRSPVKPIHVSHRRHSLLAAGIRSAAAGIRLGVAGPAVPRPDPLTAAWATPSTSAAPSHGPCQRRYHPPPQPRLAPGSSPAAAGSGPAVCRPPRAGLGGGTATVAPRPRIQPGRSRIWPCRRRPPCDGPRRRRCHGRASPLDSARLGRGRCLRHTFLLPPRRILARGGMGDAPPPPDPASPSLHGGSPSHGERRPSSRFMAWDPWPWLPSACAAPPCVPRRGNPGGHGRRRPRS
ncbi:hypothetical protein PVAP13_6KG257930 [Panicum virgatum]|uniref:Uncharacterized protein n=1 Tax=Panicum virgatum TaxID=38727 RepID=A0A8T0RD75_PANVG|nr:hypothetical protein PVAP13_6KG257930 [Panicum virgatum]